MIIGLVEAGMLVATIWPDIQCGSAREYSGLCYDFT